ncbi:MAG: hypothetical protein UF218_03405 [Eggerthellaceae bacterium]|nr:hypothetical protein [Eggerthellaceae bacterium]
MFAIDLAKEIAHTISEMEDGEVSSIARMTHHVLGGEYDGDMFLLMNLVLFECAKQGILLDYSEHDGKVEGLPFNLTFIKRSSNIVGELPEGTRICILHHPLHNCTHWPGMKFEEYEVDRAIVVFDGPFAEAKKKYWKCDSESGFTLDSQKVNEAYFVITLIDGAYKKPFEALLQSYGEAMSYEVPLCDAMEEWTFILYKDALNIDKAMEDYRRLSESEFVNIYDEKERDEFFTRFPDSAC